ncbi:MAG: hypothetical protein AB1416_01505 [Actinomycetota bacterium]
MVREMLDIPETDLPSQTERELRARWFSGLTDAEREEMIQWPFSWIEEAFSAWRAEQVPPPFH